MRPTKTQHPPILIRVFAVRMTKPWVFRYPLITQRRLWSDWVDAHTVWVFAGRRVILLVLSCRGSYIIVVTSVIRHSLCIFYVILTLIMTTALLLGWRYICLLYEMGRDMTKPTKWVCAQRRLGSAWASAQSDQSLRCPHEESLGPWLPIKRTAKTQITQTDLSLRWAQSHIVGFVMSRLKCICFT